MIASIFGYGIYETVVADICSQHGPISASIAMVGVYALFHVHFTEYPDDQKAATHIAAIFGDLLEKKSYKDANLEACIHDLENLSSKLGSNWFSSNPLKTPLDALIAKFKQQDHAYGRYLLEPGTEASEALVNLFVRVREGSISLRAQAAYYPSAHAFAPHSLSSDSFPTPVDASKNDDFEKIERGTDILSVENGAAERRGYLYN